MPVDVAPHHELAGITPPPAAPPATTPPLHVSHITGAPVSTVLGIMAALEGALHSMPGGNWPTNAMGWVGLALSLAMAVFGALSKG